MYADTVVRFQLSTTLLLNANFLKVKKEQNRFRPGSTPDPSGAGASTPHYGWEINPPPHI